MTCPTPRKDKFPTRTAALNGKSHGSQRAFQCHCGNWHLTGSFSHGNHKAFGGRA